MTAAIGLRTDFDGTALRGLARRTKDSAQARRLLALAEIYDGRTRSDAAIGTIPVIRKFMERNSGIKVLVSDRQ